MTEPAETSRKHIEATKRMADQVVAMQEAKDKGDTVEFAARMKAYNEANEERAALFAELTKAEDRG
jgi:hypothetical protein